MFRYQNETVTRIERAISQRLYLLKEIEPTASNNTCSRSFDVLGLKGDVYRVIIGTETKCTCPDWLRRHAHCKHIYFILHRYLKVPLQSELLTLSTYNELQLAQIFSIQSENQQRSNATVLAPSDNNVRARYEHIFVNKNVVINDTKDVQECKVEEKPLEEDESCPICLEEMTVNDSKQPLIWCRTQCGKHIHAHCLQHWSKAIKGTLSCPLCRSPWQEPVNPNKRRATALTKEYINLLD